MVKLHKVYDNLMVDVRATNAKLRNRAIRLVCMLGGVQPEDARAVLERAEWRVKVAVVMLRRDVDAAVARDLLASYDGSLREAIEGG